MFAFSSEEKDDYIIAKEKHICSNKTCNKCYHWIKCDNIGMLDKEDFRYVKYGCCDKYSNCEYDMFTFEIDGCESFDDLE